MYLMISFAQKQGASDGKIAADLAATRLALPPTPTLAWATARRAIVTANGDPNNLAWRIAYAVSWLQAAQGVRYRGWKVRLTHLEKLEKAYSAAAAWVDELAAPETHAPVQTLQIALKRYQKAGVKASRARVRLLLAWQQLAQGEQQPVKKAS
jgi:hypothetical protein